MGKMDYHGNPSIANISSQLKFLTSLCTLSLKSESWKFLTAKYFRSLKPLKFPTSSVSFYSVCAYIFITYLQYNLALTDHF